MEVLDKENKRKGVDFAYKRGKQIKENSWFS